MDVMRERLKESKGKTVRIFLKNNFRFEGKIINCDDRFVEILDRKLDDYKLIEIDKISDLDFLKGGERVR